MLLLRPLALVRGPLRHATVALWGRPALRPMARRTLAAYAWLDVVVRFGRLPSQPDRRFNDFLHALKTSEELDSPLRRRITDKVEGKAYVAERLGPGRTVPTLAVLTTADAIAAYRPPAYPVAVKPAHGSGELIRVGSEADWLAATRRMTGWLRLDHFARALERNYAGLARRVIVEPWLDEGLFLEGSVHCRGGVPKVVSLINRYEKTRQSFAAADRRALGVSLGFPLTGFELTEWAFFDPLLVDARRLSAELSYIRLDFYTDGRQVVFGELTNLPAAGRGRFHPRNGEAIFSEVFFAPPP